MERWEKEEKGRKNDICVDSTFEKKGVNALFY